MRHRALFPLVTALALASLVVACRDVPLEPTVGEPAVAGSDGCRVVIVTPISADPDCTSTTIQGGVDLVVAGGEVLVLPGTYAETVVIDKGLTLAATGNSPVVVTGGPSAQYGIEVTATDPVVLRGVTIDCCAAGRSGIRGQGLVDLTIEEANVLTAQIGAEVINNSAFTGGRAQFAVLNSFFDGGSPPSMLTSVFAVSDVDALILGNVVRRIQTFGCIQPQGDANADVIGNDVDECGLSNGGIAAVGMRPNTVVNIVRNRVRNSTKSASRFGILISGRGTGRIARNTVLDYVQPTATPSSSAGIRVSAFGAATPVVRFNDIAGNAHAGLRSFTSSIINATCNWWGSSDGPSGDGSGSGDAVFGPATVNPFATAPIANTLRIACSGDGEATSSFWSNVPDTVQQYSEHASQGDPFPLVFPN